jgi:hypothetical protein
MPSAALAESHHSPLSARPTLDPSRWRPPRVARHRLTDHIAHPQEDARWQNIRLYGINPFDTVLWRRAERHFLSRSLSSGEYATKFASPERFHLVMTGMTAVWGTAPPTRAIRTADSPPKGSCDPAVRLILSWPCCYSTLGLSVRLCRPQAWVHPAERARLTSWNWPKPSWRMSPTWSRAMDRLE